MSPEVIVVSHRPRLAEALHRLLHCHPGAVRRPLPPPTAAATQDHPRVALVDAPLLFPRPLDPDSPLWYQVPRLLLVAYRAEVDLAIAALNAGLHAFPLEDLRPESLAAMVAPPGPVANLYVDLGRLYAHNLRDFLDSRRERQALSPRESQILALLLRGYTNRQIAEALGIGLQGVKNHLNNVYSKLHLSGRAAAIALFAHHGKTGTPY